MKTPYNTLKGKRIYTLEKVLNDNSKKCYSRKDMEEAAEKYVSEDNCNRYYSDFIEGAKWQQERMYSEEDMRTAIFKSFLLGVDRGIYSKELEDKLIEQFNDTKNNNKKKRKE